jgi:uridine phosphorylase
MDALSPTDLILNPDGSIYHLHLFPGDIADSILLVGDPGRVGMVSGHFDRVELRKANREFVTHTGFYRGKRISVLSTGIGTDNIDIVMNELDALVNVNLEQREVTSARKSLRLVRIGTSGALHPDLPLGAEILSKVAGGFDGVYHFYKDEQPVTVSGLAEAFMVHANWGEALPHPYFVEGSPFLSDLFDDVDCTAGITLSTPGFYAPQVRSIRLTPAYEGLLDRIGSFQFMGMRILNFEMESSALYALSALLGHEALTLCVAVANRVTGKFLEDYHPHVDQLIRRVLDKLAGDE